MKRILVVLTVPFVGVGQGLVPVAAVAGGAAAITAVSAAVSKTPAHALSGSVLILSTSVNGGSSSDEAQQATALGLTVTVASAATWDAMSTASFKTYSAIIIGDPSTSTTCSTAAPTDAVSTASTWSAAVTGNVAVLGTAPALGNATTLISEAIAYAASGSGTGLYVSLNCEDSTASAGSSVPLLAHVDGGGFTVTGQGSGCPGNAGSVNAFQALALAPFNGLSSSNLGPWSSPACSVEESFGAWPGVLGGLGYLAGASPALFTASDGTTGQPYILAGATPPAATTALSSSTGGQVPALTAIGGKNPAAPGVAADLAGDPVDTENGDFTESDTDLSIPTFGPSLDFSRDYDAELAQRQSVTATAVAPGAPGSLGYGWTDNWDTSLSAGGTVPGDIYTIDGLQTGTGQGGPATSAALNAPQAVAQNSGNVYIADTVGNRIEEIPGSSGTQWGISMTAGDIYTVVGSDTGTSGVSCSNGTAMTSCLLKDPQGIVADSSGDLFVSDTGNNRVLEIPAASGTNYGISMTADDAYTVAGHASGAAGHGGDGGAANVSFLSTPTQVVLGVGGDSSLYIADSLNNRIQEVFETGGEQWGQSMTASDIYTVAGSATGGSGNSGNAGAATSALFDGPESITLSSVGDLYIADTSNCQIREVAKTSGTQWTVSMTGNDVYTVAGKTSGLCSTPSPDGTAGTSSVLEFPDGVVANNGQQLYITDGANNRIAELARTSHTEWGIAMTADDVYTIAGQVSGATGFTGNGGAATSADMNEPSGPVAFPSGGMYIADSNNNEIRLVSSTTTDISDFAGGVGTFAQDGDGGPSVEAGLDEPVGVGSDSHGDVFVADTTGNRVQEIAAYSHTQFGVTMTAGDVYTVAGLSGFSGLAGNGGPATSALLSGPSGVAVDSSGNLYIADDDNNRVQKVSASTGNISTFAGSASGTFGNSGQGGVATSAKLDDPAAVATDTAGDVFIAGMENNQAYEVPAASGTQFGITMTAGHIYTIAGSTAATSGSSGDGGPATSSLLDGPQGIATDASGNLYVSDTGNDRIQEIARTTHTQWGVSMTGGDVYTVAGSSSASGLGDGGPASLAGLSEPIQIAVDSSGDLYIVDGLDGVIREVAASSGTQWAQAMTANDIYSVVGANSGGGTSDGVPATSIDLGLPQGIGVDPFGDLFVTNEDFSNPGNSHLREVVSGNGPLVATSPAAGATWSTSGITITQPGGSQITFYPKSGGSCVSPYVAAGSGGYCALPQYTDVNLTFSSGGGGTYTYTPSPGLSYTYGSAGALQSETDSEGDSANVTYASPAPGAGNCPATATSCNTITSASGRALVIGYNSSNLVTSATDPMGRRWTYAYTGSDLTKATDPLGNITTYTYDTSNANAILANDLLTITGPNAQPGGPDAGDDTVNTYDGLGRVTQQTDPAGNATTFNYCADAGAGECMNTATGTGFTTVGDANGNTTVDDYLSGSLIGQAQLTGGTTLTSSQAFVPDQVATGSSAGSQLDTAEEDGDGNIISTTYDADGRPETQVTPSGAGSQTATTTWHFTALNNTDCYAAEQATSDCTSSSGPSAVAPGAVITPPSTAPPPDVTWTLYDTNGNWLYETTGVYEPGSSTAAYAQTSYQLFAGNSVTLGTSHITCGATPPSSSLPCATIDADGVVTQLAYDSAGDLTSSSTPDGNGTELATTTDTYDSDGEQLTEVAPDGNVTGANAGNFTTTTAYDADGDVTSVTDGNGTGHTVTPRVTSYGFDADGNQTTVDDARGFTTTTTFDANDRPVLVTDPDGNATLSCYDGHGNVAQTVPAAGVVANSLTPSSCPTAYPAGYGTRLAADATTHTFNTAGQQTSITTPAPAGHTGSETTTYTYDGAGNLTQISSPSTANGGSAEVTVNTYDAAGNLATQTTGSGTTAAATYSYCHDPDGDITSVVMPDGNSSGVAQCETSSPWVVSPTSHPTQAAYQTTSSYDSAGELVSSTSPANTVATSGATTTYTYDPGGNELTMVDPNGVTTTWTYVPGGLPATASFSGSSAHSVSYGYDANGNQTSMGDATGSSSYSWDPFSELTSSTNGAGQTVGYGYDADGDPTSITYPLPSSATWATSDTVSYGYDHADQLTSATDFNGNQITITNNANNLPSAAALGSSGDTINTTYTSSDWPSAIALKNATSTLQSFTYSDAPAGNVLSETDTPTSSQSPAVYTYDAKGRVTSMTPGTASADNYAFDASGNPTELPTGAAGSYNNASELTSSVLSGTTTSYTYNADGQRLTAAQGGTTIASGTWNGASELTAYSAGSGSMGSGAYDGNGLRASATFTPAGGTASSQAFVWGSNFQLLMDSGNAYIYTGGTAPAEQVSLSGGTVRYLDADLLGSVRGTVTSSGSLSATTSYDAWGNPQSSGGLTSVTPFGFAGGYTDPDGLIYLINRYYDPATGQFTSVDPAVASTLEPYSYAGDDPVVNVDPTGTFWWIYETTHRTSQLAGNVYYDLSPKMAEEAAKSLEKAAEKGIDKVSKWLSLCAAALAVFVHNHPLLAGIMFMVAAAIAILPVKHVAKLLKWIKGVIYSAKHKKARGNGFYLVEHEDTGFPETYGGWVARSCDKSQYNCGSPADHEVEIWPKPKSG